MRRGGVVDEHNVPNRTGAAAPKQRPETILWSSEELPRTFGRPLAHTWQRIVADTLWKNRIELCDFGRCETQLY